MKKIIIADEIFDKTIAYQSFYNGETFGGKIVEIEDEYYDDCVREDFDGYVFNLEKYNTRKQEEQKAKCIPEIQTRLNELSEDFIQATVGAKLPDINERIAEFRRLHNELRTLLGKEPREYKE